MRSKIDTATLKHRVTVCTSRDVIIAAGGSFQLQRIAAWDTWAGIEPTRGQLFSRDGAAIKEGREQPSHKITVRAKRSILLSSSAWVYEARRISPPRWFKVLDYRDVYEEGVVWELYCRQVERADDAIAPATPKEATQAGLAVPLPTGVDL